MILVVAVAVWGASIVSLSTGQLKEIRSFEAIFLGRHCIGSWDRSVREQCLVHLAHTCCRNFVVGDVVILGIPLITASVIQA